MENFNGFLPSNMDMTDLLLDTEFCAALGVYPDSGCCVRHPSHTIIAKGESDGEKIIRSCPMCDKETQRRRQSYANAILHVQKLHNDEHGWMEFKKTWDSSMRSSESLLTESLMTSESKDASIASGLNFNFQADAENADTPRRLDLHSPSSILCKTNKYQIAWKEYSWQVILRTTQVQEWAMIEKDKEIEILRQKLQSFSTDSTTEQSSTIGSSNRISHEYNPTHIQPIVEENPPQLPSRRSSSRFAAHIGKKEDGIKAFLPSAPQRQRSSDMFSFEATEEGDIDDYDDEDSDVDSDEPLTFRQSMGMNSNSNRGIGRLNVRPSKFQAIVPPTLPKRQVSNERLRKSGDSHNKRSSSVSAMSELTNPSMFSTSFSTSIDSFVLQGESERDLAAGVGVHVTGMENHTTFERPNRMSNSRQIPTTNLETIRSGEFVLDTDDKTSKTSMDEITPLTGSYRKSVEPSLPERIIEGEEISLIPSVMEEPPPPPPPPPEDSPGGSMEFPYYGNGSSTQQQHQEYLVPLSGSSNKDIKLEASMTQDIQFDASKQDIPFDASQDIHFDASQDIRFNASLTVNDASNNSSMHDSDIFRRSSIADMEFSDKDKLMQEASKAFSTPQYVSRKLRAQDFRKTPSGRNRPASTFRSMLSSSELVFSERSSEESEPQRPASAGDMKKPPPNSNKLKAPPPASKPIQIKTPDRSSNKNKLLNLEDFLEQNHGNDDEPELAEFGDLPVNSGFLRLDGGGGSPVSCVTMLTTEHASMFGGSAEDDEDVEPSIGLNEGGTRRLLPMEEGFHSDEESSSDEEEKGLPPVVQKETIDVVDEIVNDEYGDSGLYTGSVTADGRIPHGRGVMMYENEREYNGDWSDGQWHGQGEWVNPNGDRYNGTFVLDTRHGEGTYSWRNGNMYKGEFMEDKRQGKGVFTFANGNVYEGDFINGVFEGEGKYNFGNGFYRGSWKGGKYHGTGFLQFNDGSSYSGTFVEGVAHGEGKEISADGKTTTGFWNQGVAPDSLTK